MSVAGSVLTLEQIGLSPVRELLAAYGLVCEPVEAECDIPGSFWGESEAGLVGNRLLARVDTPVHSILHEACHYVCMTPDRRRGLHTDAGGDYDEESAVCFLQVVLADYLAGAGSSRLMRDMDTWGYSFRLGSARAWFERDADEARDWLVHHRLLDAGLRPTWRLRGG